MSYDRIFDPGDASETSEGQIGGALGGSVYVYTDEIVLAVNVALATGRPLLVCGPPGSGKSTLAAHIASRLDWRYSQHVISSRTQGRDLQWRFDNVRRLRDAQLGLEIEDAGYVSHGVLWDAFAAAEAGERTVVLLDEIDKADPDVPNSLLEALGSLSFTVDETGERVQAHTNFLPLVVVTTNDERELSRPFLRRCVVLTLPPPDLSRLVTIARAHNLAPDADELYIEVAQIVDRLRAESVELGMPSPSTAEYLDALRACVELRVTPGSPEWDVVERATLAKRVDRMGAL